MARTRAEVRLVERADGTVGAEIRTSPPLGMYEGFDGNLYSPEEYLRHPNVGFKARGVPPRHMVIQAGVTGQLVVDRILDQSEGSQEREMLGRLLEQKQFSVLWVNEGVEVVETVRVVDREDGREALEQTRGLSHAQWREEVEEIEWQQSAAYRPGRPRPRKQRRRSARPPQGAPLPFFAPRSGAIPKAKNPQVDGVRLPAGRRVPDEQVAYWISEDPVAKIELLVPWLASRFSDTGLWPLLWRLNEEEPFDYGGPADEIDAIETVDLLPLLHLRWNEHPPSDDDDEGPTDFPGLAAAQAGDQPQNPFPHWALSELARLLLVPCNRPADAIMVIGGVGGENDQRFISAMQRSWEERFGAVIYELAPGMTRLSVARPPTDDEQALALAAEIHACHIIKAELKDRPLHDIAHDLQYGQHDAAGPISLAQISTRAWDIVW
jgi:Domain of unknown function (DUF4253)